MDCPKKSGLYDPQNEKDACGIGLVMNIKGIASHLVIQNSLEILTHLEHRGGTGFEDDCGDGAGILLNIPHRFFESINLGFTLPKEGDYAVAMLFLSQNEEMRDKSEHLLEKCFLQEGLDILGNRIVPLNTRFVGATALSTMPLIKQWFIKRKDGIEKGIDFERYLYMVRRIIEKKMAKEQIEKFYFCSFSSKTIVYKGMLLSNQVKDFYLDLQNTLFEAKIALVHSRFSTNTFPSWERAHPNRFLIHNGEINTIRGNVDSIGVRESLFKSEVYGKNLERILPVIEKPSSDSAMLDNTVEFLFMNGRSLPESMITLIPEPWDKDKNMDPIRRDFYEYCSTFMEPWDGPTAICATDGDMVCAMLDRNGLRPARYFTTKDGFLVLSSETGALPIDESNVLLKKRLEPGKILVCDTLKGKILSDDEVKKEIGLKRNYKEWNQNILKLKDMEIKERYEEDPLLLVHQVSSGYSYDNIQSGIIPCSEKGEERLVSMGQDTPLAVISKRNQSLFCFFKQLFAQVTNPPIDAIREEVVTSTIMYLGCEGNLLVPNADNARRIRLEQPILSNGELDCLKTFSQKGFHIQEIDFTYDCLQIHLKEAIDSLQKKAIEAVNQGAEIIILTDKAQSENRIAIPVLLATSSVHKVLVENGRRTHCSIVVETSEAREIHHYACLLGFGATAINPYLVFATINDSISKGLMKKTNEEACHNYIKASMKGIVKIASKMGISTIQSYNGAQIFEVVGISQAVCEKYFNGVTSQIGGIGLCEIEKNSRELHDRAYHDLLISLDSEGLHGLRNHRENHLYNPFTIYKLQEACRRGDYSLFKEYSNELQKKSFNLRDLILFKAGNAISIDEVEPVDSIVKRFKTGAMSFGSISQEAHECMAIAMNRLGGKSNTGEGGELSSRYILKDQENKCSQIKQVASGRFGVTMEYLMSANEIQIKMAQGAKPGEGGQLPGKKVYPIIAKSRYSTPGVTLISPPPHHDIYSIEDLSQLIFDLKNANRKARISVKLVSEKGIGCVASGVAKAGANVILISGYDGGTGASPRTSIKNAGIPWEIGLADTHQTLVMNHLRERVSLETDGKLMTGRDLAIAAILGAEEFGFATAPLITLGCIMMRVCNQDTCPTGIATQSPLLRKNFKGKPEYVINFMRFIAQELREYMAKLGFRTINEMIGRYDVLDCSNHSLVDLSMLINNENVWNKTHVHFEKIKETDFLNTLDMKTLIPLSMEALNKEKKTILHLPISNVNRATGTILSSEIVKRYGEKGLKENTIEIFFDGHAGNSFGAFLTSGVHLHVDGDANDYIGKGLCGGIISVGLDKVSTLDQSKNMIAGNVILYGATKGECYLDGFVGERFAVRNSGAICCSLGTGEHALEYMTGGTALILGPVGRNCAAGMSGGIAYLYGVENKEHVNKDSVQIEDISDCDALEIQRIGRLHIHYTHSKYVEKLLATFNKNDFFKIVPKDYETIQKMVKNNLDLGLEEEEAKEKAFMDFIGREN